MVHRLQNRNSGYPENSVGNIVKQHTTLSATEGATALDLNNVINENEIIKTQSEQKEVEEKVIEPELENISIENATYLQNVEQNENPSEDLPAFEVDSIELATPDLFSKNDEITALDNTREEKIQESKNISEKEEAKINEPEMFEKLESEEDFEIPAFLRRQKN